MSVKNWSFSYSRKRKTEWKQNILDTISLWGAIGLLWFSFVSIIGEHFPEFLQVVVLASKSDNISTSYVDASNFVEVGMDWWVISLFVIVLWLGYDWPKQYLKKLVLPCRLLGVFLPIAYIVVNFQKIVAGFWYLASLYLPFINNYYKTRFYFAETGTKSYATVAFTAIVLLLWWLAWMLAYGWKKRVLLALFPLFALIFELVVGLSPMGDGLFYMFVAAMILMLLGGTSIVKKVVALACVCASIVVAGVGFSDDIEVLGTKETKQSLLRWQNNLSLEDLNPLKWLQIDLHFNWEPLNNNTPQYTGKIVLEVETDHLPQGTVYLKGFYGTNYKNGNWTYDDSAFRAACKDAGKDATEVAKQIFQMPYKRLEILANHSVKQKTNYKIQYTGTTGNVAYAPYGTSYDSLDEDYTLMGDYLLKKSILDNKIEGTNVNIDFGSEMTLRSLSASIEKGFGNYNAGVFLSYWYEPIEVEESEEELDFLNGLSDAYREMPADIEFLSEALEYLEKNMQSTEYDFNFLTEGENYHRIYYSEKVTNYLASRMSYSLKLDNLPMGKDPIDYALNESHEGYCMHFASAATLLLRGLDIPARYVSGYAVAPSSFVLDEETGLYRAEVGDFMAHAWVEIYLDNIGWVPVDPTPGSNLDNLPTEDDIDRWESDSNANRQDIINEERESESENSETESEETEVVTEDSQTEDTEQEVQEQTESEEEKNPQAGGSDSQKPDTQMLLKIVGILGGIAISIFLLFAVIRSGISRYEAVLTMDIEKNMNRRAVKRMNRRLYNMVRLAKIGNWFQRKWTDAEYHDALVERFTEVSGEEWDKFMDIVKKNHYSHEKISVEEMQYCYECYKKAKLFNISLTKLWENKK